MKTFKKPLGAIVFLSWMPLKYATVTSFSRPHLSRNSGLAGHLNKRTFYSSIYKTIDQ